MGVESRAMSAEEQVLGKRKAEVLSDAELDVLLADRCAARMRKDFATSDRLRDELRANGMQIMDKEGIWKGADGRSGPLNGTVTGTTVPAMSRHMAPAPAPQALAVAPAGDVGALIEQREQHRFAKEWAAADAIRDTLKIEHRVTISDDHRTWRSEEGFVGLVVREGSSQLAGAQICTMLEAREDARKAHDWARADEIRDLLKRYNVNLEDTGRTWSTNDGRRGTYRPMEGFAAAGMMPAPHPMMPYGQPYGAMMPQPYGHPYGMQMPAAPQGAPGAVQTADIERLIHQREITRRDKQWAESDTLRDQLQEIGVRVDNKLNTWPSSDGRSGVVPRWSDLDSFQPSAAAQYQMRPPMPQGYAAY